MKWLVLGDIHGEFGIANKLIEEAIAAHPDINRIIQVGDLGHGWPDEDSYYLWMVPEIVKNNKIPIHWLDGNHDNFDFIKKNKGSGDPHIIYQDRGSVLEADGVRVMFCGGAYSIDKHWRTLGRSYWAEETITGRQLNKAYKNSGPFDAIFTHDRPDFFNHKFIGHNKDKDLGGRSDRIALEGLWTKYKPKFWFFGHYHNPDNGVDGNTEWTCCPMISDSFMFRMYTIWDGKAVKRTWDSIPAHRAYAKLKKEMHG